MRFRLVIYAIVAITGQVYLGKLTGQGQGGISMLLFTIMVELDPQFSFTHLLTKKTLNKKDTE